MGLARHDDHDISTRGRDLQLIIRVHPAELRGHIQSRQPIAEEIRREIGPLPPNIHVIPPDSPVSTYAVMTQCDSVLIYGTKTGVELTSLGVPVIVAGEAWIRNKGITIDARSREHYLRAARHACRSAAGWTRRRCAARRSTRITSSSAG